jgi:hypothetical protein
LLREIAFLPLARNRVAPQRDDHLGVFHIRHVTSAFRRARPGGAQRKKLSTFIP